MCHDHHVLVEEVVRRNRRRIALLTVVTVVNYMIMVAAGAFLIYLISSMFDDVGYSSQGLLLFAGLSLAAGALSGVSAVVRLLRSAHERTLAELGAVPLAPGDLPVVDNLLAELSIATGTPRPAAALVASDAPNPPASCRPPGGT